MAAKIFPTPPDGISSILLVFLFIITPASDFISLQAQQLTQTEFSAELRGAYNNNDDQLAVSLIKDHRLFVKAFVNDLITESISKELKGKTVESEQAKDMAEKAASGFEKIFGEKNLTTGVNYLKSWSKDQKGKKLVADSLYALGTTFRVNQPEKAIEIYQQAI